MAEKPTTVYVLGSRNSGKSSFIRRLVKDADCPTVKLGKRCYATELNLRNVLDIDKTINIIEYRGIKHYGKLRFQYASADACLLFYDCDDKISFYEACNVQWWCHYLIYGNPPTFLVGNKSDLFTNERVDRKHIKQTQQKYNEIRQDFEISSKTGVGIRELFDAVLGSSSSSNVTTTATPDVSPRQHIDELVSYTQSGSVPGVCFIINNAYFPNTGMGNREGSEKDVENIQSTFLNIGFHVRIAENMNVSSLKKRIEDMARVDHSDNNAFVCVIMSHGGPFSVFGSDGLPIDIKRLTEPFSGQNCPSLRGKPKIFLIQACQGSRQDQMPVDGCDRTDATLERPTIPTFADILVGYATVNEFAAYRDTQHGSPYIRTICETVRRFPDLHIVDILTIVNREVSEIVVREVQVEEGREADATSRTIQYKQMPMFESSLTKRAFLTPPSLIFGGGRGDS